MRETSQSELSVMERQLDEMRGTSQSEALLQVIRWISEPEMRDSRKRLILKQKTSLSSWSAEEKTNAKKVCVFFDVIEILIKNRVIPAGVIEVHWANTIILCRQAADELIQNARTTIRPDAWKEFEDLCTRAREVVPFAMSNLSRTQVGHPET